MIFEKLADVVFLFLKLLNTQFGKRKTLKWIFLSSHQQTGLNYLDKARENVSIPTCHSTSINTMLDDIWE